MNRSSFALFVALLIHFLVLLLFLRLAAISPEIKKEALEEKRLRVSLKELPKPKPVKKQTVSAKPEKIVKPEPIAPPMPKGSQLKEIVTKPPVKYVPQAKPKKPKLNKIPKVQKQKPPVKKVQKLPEKKYYVPLVPLKKDEIKKEETAEMDWLLEDMSDEIQEEAKTQTSGASAGKNIKELYGDTFGELTKGQQEYIIDNQEIMRRITQATLTRQARVTDMHGINANRSNVIEFYLHPNGDMSDFRFLEKSGYFVLDDITKATIEYSYSKYPLPKEKTLIRYNVFYNLRR